MDNNNKLWLDTLVHLREAVQALSAIHVQCQDGYEKATADMILEALADPRAQAWKYVRANCSLEEIAARNL